MKRDWNLIREILLEIESLPTYSEDLKPNNFDGYDGVVVNYHISLLIEAELITAENLTWQGHEFLDSIRGNSTWKQFKQTLADKSISLSFTAIKTVALHYLSQQLK